MFKIQVLRLHWNRQWSLPQLDYYNTFQEGSIWWVIWLSKHTFISCQGLTPAGSLAHRSKPTGVWRLRGLGGFSGHDWPSWDQIPGHAGRGCVWERHWPTLALNQSGETGAMPGNTAGQEQCDNWLSWGWRSPSQRGSRNVSTPQTSLECSEPQELWKAEWVKPVPSAAAQRCGWSCSTWWGFGLLPSESLSQCLHSAPRAMGPWAGPGQSSWCLSGLSALLTIIFSLTFLHYENSCVRGSRGWSLSHGQGLGVLQVLGPAGFWTMTLAAWRPRESGTQERSNYSVCGSSQWVVWVTRGPLVIDGPWLLRVLWRLAWVSTELRPGLLPREEGSKDPIYGKSSNITQWSRYWFFN